MGGKQFSFFLGLTDQVMLDEVIRSSGHVAFLPTLSRSEIGKEIKSSIIRDPENESFKILIARRVDVPMIKFIQTGSPNKDFAYEPFEQLIVEYSRFVRFKNFIRAGRMYRLDKYWNKSDELVSKSPEFVEWADLLYKLVKKSLTKVEQGFYAGPEALAMRRSGIPFEMLDIEFDSIRE